MPNLNTAQLILTGATTKRSLKDRLDERFLSVKDFGATGNGSTDDTAAIQAAIDYCYGTFASPHGDPEIIDAVPPPDWSFGSAMFTNKVLRFPAGNYKVSAPLKLAVGYGPTFVGDGSRCTRLFWSGPARGEFNRVFHQATAPTALMTGDLWYDSDASDTEYRWNGSSWVTFSSNTTYRVTAEYMRVSIDPATLVPGDVWFDTTSGSPKNPVIRFSNQWVDHNASLLSFYTCWHVHVEGMTLDAGGVQDCALRSYNWPTFSGNYANDGHDGYYYDVHFTNPVNTATSGCGHLAFGVAMGSERTYVNCRFSLCRFGVRLAQANALNHEFVNCEFFDNYTGYDEVTGGAGSFTNCWFSNNSVIDIHGQQNMFHVENCYSTSKNFCSVDGVVTGCTHDHPSAGMFWTSLIATIPGDPGTSGWYTGTDTEKVVFTGNRSTNGTLSCSTSSGASLILKGNTFTSASYRTGVPATALLWQDGVQISP